jgi:GT2 family glycosyltransferase
MGVCRATNKGLCLAYMNTAAYILIVDNDITIPQGDRTWLTRLIRYLEENSSIGAVGPLTDNVGAHDIMALPNMYVEAWQNSKLKEQGRSGYVSVKWLTNFCTLFRKDALRSIKPEGATLPGPLIDEHFEPGGSEDVDLCVRLRISGWELVLAPDVFVHHQQGGTFRDLNIDHETLLKQNRQKLEDKFGTKFYAEIGVD